MFISLASTLVLVLFVSNATSLKHDFGKRANHFQCNAYSHPISKSEYIRNNQLSKGISFLTLSILTAPTIAMAAKPQYLTKPTDEFVDEEKLTQKFEAERQGVREGSRPFLLDVCNE